MPFHSLKEAIEDWRKRKKKQEKCETTAICSGHGV